MREVVIVSAGRTTIGNFCGTLKDDDQVPALNFAINCSIFLIYSC